MFGRYVFCFSIKKYVCAIDWSRINYYFGFIIWSRINFNENNKFDQHVCLYFIFTDSSTILVMVYLFYF